MLYYNYTIRNPREYLLLLIMSARILLFRLRNMINPGGAFMAIIKF